jgi:diguanylate cyclase (GGDEF)-like protein
MARTLEINSLKSLVASLEDALEQKEKSQRRLNYIATHDVLTGLQNRYAFKKHIERLFKNNNRIILLVIDLSHFKDINDTLGHDIGDCVLQVTAKIFKESLEDEANIYRLGGDEFAIVLHEENEHSCPRERDILDKLIKIFKSKYKIKGNRIRIDGSIGICIAPQDAKTPQELFKRADIAMYEAKHNSQHTLYKYFDATLEKKLNEKKILEDLILDMIQTKEFEVYYQPKIETTTENIIGLEALIRVRGHSEQILPADKVINVAEENNLIDTLGEVIIDKSFQFLKEIKKLSSSDINLALNISSLQIKDGFIENLESYLHKNNLLFSDITIEITEGILINRPAFVKEKLDYFHAKGIGLSIDDFGTGFSSLSYLHSFPFSELKIDRSFISEIENNDIKKKIVIGIIQLAHAIDLKVVAEGVETEAQYQFLKSAHCDYIQGHLFYPALPSKEILRIIQSQEIAINLNSAEGPCLQNEYSVRR